MIARIPALLLVLAAALLLAAGCGDDEGSSSDDGGSTDTTEEPAAEDTDTESNDEASAPAADGLVLGVNGNDLAFDKTELTAPAGSVTITLENTSSIQHNVAIEDADGEELAAGELVGDGGTSTITVDLEPGTYTYFCSPHKSSGMVGTLTVT